MFRTLKAIVLSLTVFLCGAAVQAQDVSGYPIGYCNGELSTSSRVKHDKAGDWVSSALYITPELAATVASNHIDQMHFGLCSTIHVEKVKIWVRSELSGENLCETTVDVSALKKGWNTVDFETPYNIPSDGKGFYLGYSVLQDGRSAGPSLLQKSGTGTFYYQAGDGEWQDKSDEYILCLEGLVYGDNLPKYNVTLENVTTQSVFIVTDGNLKCVAKVRNCGIVTVTKLDFKIEVSGAVEPVTDVTECSIPFGEVKDVAFTVRPVLASVPEDCEVKVTVTSVNGNSDENVTDNAATSSFLVMEDAFPRVVMLEEFTTERCPNCPAAATKLHNVLADPQYSENVLAICHHSGYHYDSYTTDFDKEYEWFYNDNGGTYAPAMMLDRALTVESGSAVFFPSSESMLKEEIDKRLAAPSMVSVNVAAQKESENKLTVKVNGKRIGTGDELYVTVFLVENDIATDNQAGAGPDYMHQHVGRAVNSTWGSPVERNGEEYSYECTFTLDDKWNFNNMEVLAMLARYDSTDATACMVENAGRFVLRNLGINEVAGDEEKEVIGYYDVMGRKLTEKPYKGIYVTVYSDGSCRKSLDR